MAATVLVDTSFLVALLSRRDARYDWARRQSRGLLLPWLTCEAVLSEHSTFSAAVVRPASLHFSARAVVSAFDLGAQMNEVLVLMGKYADVPMSLADGCLVRMTEQLPDSIVVTLDHDFRVYRRHGRRATPCIMPG